MPQKYQTKLLITDSEVLAQHGWETTGAAANSVAGSEAPNTSVWGNQGKRTSYQARNDGQCYSCLSLASLEHGQHAGTRGGHHIHNPLRPLRGPSFRIMQGLHPFLTLYCVSHPTDQTPQKPGNPALHFCTLSLLPNY